MLTNLFYYDFYKPYIFKNEKLTARKPILNQRSEKSEKTLSSNNNNNTNEDENEYSFFLNKAFKTEIVNYADTISSDLNSLKKIAKDLVYNQYNNFNAENFNDTLKNKLNEFGKKYNQYKNFAEENSKQSPLLSTFLDNLEYRVETNMECLEKFNFSYDTETKELFFDEEAFDSLDFSIIANNYSDLQNFCSTIYDDTCEIMTVPMEEHMNFKNLNYYYNYIFSNEKHNTVKIIESGMLVDISL